MKLGSTLFLRAVVILIGAFILGLCVFALPIGIQEENAGGYRWILLGLYIPALPFFYALYQTMWLLHYIDTNQAFSKLAVESLRKIRNCAITISALFAAGMPYIFQVADRDDAPGVVAMGLVIVGASLAIATFAAVLQKLLHSAIAIKEENDLTV